MLRANVVQFPIPEELEIRLERARLAAQKDRAVREALKHWFAIRRQGGALDDDAGPILPPTTPAEATDVVARLRENSCRAWTRFIESLDREAADRDREIDEDMRPRRRRGQREA